MTRGSAPAAPAVVALLAAFVLIPACGGSDTPAKPDSCEARDGLICAPKGFPFVMSVFADSDFCDPDFVGVGCPATTVPPAGTTIARLSNPAEGTVCLAGTVNPTAPNPFAAVLFQFDTPFDAAARGITQWAVTIDSPPAAGLLAGSFGFHVGTPPVYITQPGPQMIRFADFTRNDNAAGTIDTSAMPPIGFAVREGSYDFCVHDFKLLDAAGAEVTP